MALRRSRRPPRPSKWRTKAKPLGEPKYNVGDRIDACVVDMYRGHSAVVPGDGRRLAVEHHWYECNCDCGNRTIRTQQQLNDTRRRNACDECLSKPKDQ